METSENKKKIYPKKLIQKEQLTEQLTLFQAYQYYVKDLDKKSKCYIDRSLYRQICQKFNENLSEALIDGEIVDLPFRLGYFRIKKKKIILNRLKVDWGTWKKTGIITHHLNSHSNEYYYKFFWGKRDMIVKNKSYYCFIPARVNQRALAKAAKENGKCIKYFD